MAAPRLLAGLWLCLGLLARGDPVGGRGLLAPGNASLQRAAAGVASAARPVVVEVFYKVNCPHCADFVSGAVLPLAEARLPGVLLTLLPMIEPPGDAQQCLANPLCRVALPPLCALRPTFPQPTAADAPDVVAAVKFVACDLVHTGGGFGAGRVSKGTVRECAGVALLHAEQLEACANGPQAFDTMFSDAYIDIILGAVRQLKVAGFPEHINMPLIFLDGDLMECSGGGCEGIKHPGGVTPLAEPGSLLQLVCGKLPLPKPDTCLGAVAARPVVVRQPENCNNCDEMGIFQWRRPEGLRGSGSTLLPQLLLCGLGAAACAAGVLGRLALHLWRSAPRRSRMFAVAVAEPESAWLCEAVRTRE